MSDFEHPATIPLEQLLSQCDFQATRRGGPGGQHRNKVETAVIVSHRPTGIQAEASERRSQANNRSQALHRLRIRLAIQIRSAWAIEPDRSSDSVMRESSAVKPTDLWGSRMIQSGDSVSAEHADYPALLAELLDALCCHGWSISAAAGALQVSSSQLVRFLRKLPTAIQHVNQARAKLDLPALK